MDARSKLLKLKELFHCLEYKRCDDGFRFDFVISEKTISLLNELSSENIPINSFSVNGVFIDFESLESQKKEKCEIEILSSDLRDKGLNIYHSWNDFLEYKPNLISIPNNYLILSDETIHPCEQTTGKSKHYQEICSFIRLLCSHADHVNHLSDKVVDEVIFLHKYRLNIPISITGEGLGEGLDGISIVDSLFEDNSHKSQKESILKEVLNSFIVNVAEQDRLQHLVTNFGDFSKRLNENYQLFVSEFSFDDVRKEYEESKRDYFSKLNNIFSSVQTKMLGIPISLALASLKMSAIIDDITFWTNFLLVISVIIYSTMMIMLIKNQKHTLGSLKNEYESQMARLKHQYSEQYEKIKNIEDELNARHDFQERCLNWFYVMSACLFFLVLALFFWNLPWKIILGIA